MANKTLPFVLSDCDGTITPIYNNVLPETANDILTYQKKSNNHFSFITGRTGIVNKQLVDELKITLPIVSCNGALITDTKTWKVLHAEYIDKDVVAKIVRKAYELGLTNILFDPEAIVGMKDSARINYWNDYRANLKKKYDFQIKIYEDIEKLVEDIVAEKVNVVEIVVVAETKDQMKTMKTILAQFNEKVDYSQSHKVLFNVTKTGVNKGSGLKVWAEILKTDYRDVVVFGDNHNDIPMIQEVTYGYAMGNSVKPLKEVAYRTIGSLEENGVGVKLQEIMNNEY